MQLLGLISLEAWLCIYIGVMYDESEKMLASFILILLQLVLFSLAQLKSQDKNPFYAFTTMGTTLTLIMFALLVVERETIRRHNSEDQAHFIFWWVSLALFLCSKIILIFHFIGQYRRIQAEVYIAQV